MAARAKNQNSTSNKLQHKRNVEPNQIKPNQSDYLSWFGVQVALQVLLCYGYLDGRITLQALSLANWVTLLHLQSHLVEFSLRLMGIEKLTFDPSVIIALGFSDRFETAHESRTMRQIIKTWPMKIKAFCVHLPWLQKSICTWWKKTHVFKFNMPSDVKTSDSWWLTLDSGVRKNQDSAGITLDYLLPYRISYYGRWKIL